MYGPERTILGFCAALPAFSFECSIGHIYRAFPGDPPDHPLRAAAARQSLPYAVWPGAPLQSFSLIRALRRHIEENRFDVVHAHDYKANWAALAATRSLPNRPALVSTPRHSERRLLLRILQSIDKHFLPYFDRITEASPAAFERLASDPRLKPKLRLLRHGIHSIEPGARGPAQPLPPTNGNPVITIAARLEAVKNHSLLLEATRLVANQIPNIQLWIAGEGSLKSTLQAKAAALGLATQTHFLGYREDIGHLYKNSSLAVIASTFETSCRAAMEALAYGCPLVSTPVGIVPELSRDGTAVLLTPHADPSAMAEAILRVLRDPALAQSLRERGLQSVAEAASHRDAARQLAAIYSEALASR